MALGKVGSVAGAQVSQAVEGGGKKFGDELKALSKVGKGAGRPQQANGAGPAAQQSRAEGVGAPQQQAKVSGPRQVAAARTATVERTPSLAKADQVLGRLTEAQARMDKVLAMAQSGRTFTAAELVAMQAQVLSASQQLDLAGKVVEKATGGIKQVLQTQI